MGHLNSRCARCKLGSASGDERLHPDKGNKTKQNKNQSHSFSRLAAGGEGAGALQGVPGVVDGKGRERLCHFCPMEVLIKWKEIIIKFTAIPQSTAVCAFGMAFVVPTAGRQ